jgi:type I restriction enzyme M protein
MREENSGEDGLLAEVIEGEGERQKITSKALRARLKQIGRDPVYAEERAALEAYAGLLEQHTEAKAKCRTAQQDLDKKIDEAYPKLSDAEIKTLVVDDKWMGHLSASVQGELDRVSQKLTGRIRQLADRYATPLPTLTEEVETLSAQVAQPLELRRTGTQRAAEPHVRGRRLEHTAAPRARPTLRLEASPAPTRLA